VNVDEQPDLANRFGIISIPALLVFKNGELVQQKLGAVPKHEIEGLFKSLI
jgi:thioredoxin 1